MFPNSRRGHLATIFLNFLGGETLLAAVVPPSPQQIEMWAHLITQFAIAVVTIWAAVRKAMQKPEKVIHYQDKEGRVFTAPAVATIADEVSDEQPGPPTP